MIITYIVNSTRQSLFHHGRSGDFPQSSSDIHAGESLYGRREGSHQFVDLVGRVVVAADQNDLLGLGERSSNLRSNGWQSLQHQGHHGGVSVLLVGRGLQPHTLRLRLADSLHSSGLGSSDQFDFLSFSLGSLDHPGPVTLGHGLNLEGLSLGWQLHGGRQLLLLPLDLLLLDLDLLPPLHHLDLDLLVPDLLLYFSCLQLVSKLSLSFLERNKNKITSHLMIFFLTHRR